MLRRATAIVEVRKSCTFALTGLVAFARHPRLDQNLDTGVISRNALSFWLLIFSFAVTAISALLALPLIVFSSTSPGDNLNVVFGQSTIFVIVTVVILGPLFEEMVFRGWLTGTIQALAGSAVFLAIVLGGSWLVRHLIPDAPVLGTQAGVAAIGLLAFSRSSGRKVGFIPRGTSAPSQSLSGHRDCFGGSTLQSRDRFADLVAVGGPAVGRMRLVMGLCQDRPGLRHGLDAAYGV